MTFTRFPNRTGYEKRKVRVSLRKLAAQIGAKTAKSKEELPWIKAATFGDDTSLSPSGKSYRTNANVEAVNGVEGDHDTGAMQPEEARALLQAARLAALIYTTASHTPQKPRWRVICPFSKPMPPNDRYGLLARVNGVLKGALAGESFVLSQCYYAGGVEGRPPVQTFLAEGRYLDLADDLDAGAMGKPGTTSGATGNDERLDVAAALKAIRTSENFHVAAIRLAGHWAARGEPLLRVGEKLRSVFNEVPDTERDSRWYERVKSIPDILTYVYGREMSKVVRSADDDLMAEFDEIWIDQHPDGEEPELVDELAGFDLDQDGVIRAFTDRHVGELLFDHNAGRWFRFIGHRWEREETQLAKHYARAISVDLAARDSKAKALKNVNVWEAIERGARTVREFAFSASGWDSDAMLLGTPGGVVDLRTGQLRPGQPDDYVSKATAITPVPLGSFDPESDCARWLAFLDQALGGDTAAIRFFQQWAGYNLTGETREQVLLFIYGPGGSGKTTAVSVLYDLMAEYAANVATSTLTAQRHEAHPEELARLHGPRMAVASETEAGSKWAENRIKALTGGDPITARFMRQDSFEFRPAFKLTIVGNNAPGLSDVDSAIRRRFLILPFDHPPAAKDEHLPKKLKSEWPGILSWAIRGALDWQENGLVRPAVVEAATRDYFAREDTFARWLEDECERIPDKATLTAELFESWRDYAYRNREDPGSLQRTFPEKLKKAGFEGVKNRGGIRGRGFIGLKLRERVRDDFDDLV
ncbi:phage/plasmid primase, P4 family [Limimaricola variabilis]|uniref:phage/plasmid primase, P4 family n=1 Tax=Limimaricola variabilis TaxID=1492771 RepID=UPI002AC93E04|nr:phage/plasmid primase, P4 family [Limimaricola variabilis]WPY95262.1 phage/plasmid primase, P4 family [Limimaricola variabilis]